MSSSCDTPDQGGSMDRGSFVKKTAGAVLSASAVGALTGSGLAVAGPAAAPRPPARPTGRLRVPIDGEPTGLNPARWFSRPDLILLRNVYDGLVNWDPTYSRLAPALAKSWRSSRDGLEWVFNLRRVTFHDGEPVDSTAIRKSFEWYQTQQGSLGALLLPPKFSKLDDSDPNVLRVVLPAPFPDFLRNQIYIRAISPKLLARGTDAITKTPVGSGPFRFASWEKGRRVLLEAFDGFWGLGPYVQRLELPLITDLSAQLNALLAGSADLVQNVPPRQAVRLGKDSRFRVSTVGLWSVTALAFRVDQKPVNDVRVRRAIAHAINREAIAQRIKLGFVTVARSPAPPGVYGYKPTRTQYPYDPTKARALLKAAGYSRRGPTVKLAVPGGSEETDVAQAITAQLREVGFDAKLDVLDAGVLNRELFGDNPRHQVFQGSYGWINGGPLHFTVNSFKSGSRWNNAREEALVKQMLTTPDGAKRLEILAKLQEIVQQQLPQLALHSRRRSDVFRAKVHGYRTPADDVTANFGSVFLS